MRSGDASPERHGDDSNVVTATARDQTLKRYSALLERIKLAYGTDGATFERDIVGVVDRYADFVHSLPATADNFFSNRNGLFELGLQVAFYALQATDGQIFSGRASISIRRELEPRWRLATFIAGLCHELHKTLSHVIVTDANGEHWPAYLQPLRTWLRGSERYEIHWMLDAIEVRSLGVLALPQIVSTETLQHLAHANSIIVPQMMASLAGLAGHHERNVLNEIVLRAASLVIDQDLRAMRERLGRSVDGEHVSRYLIHALQQLIASNATWRPNTEKSRAWFAQDGLFLVWPSAAIDMQRFMDSERFAGLPQRPKAILEALVAADVVQSPSDDCPTWPIYPPGCQGPLEAIRIRTPGVLFDNGAAPVALPIRLLAPPSNTGAQVVLELPPPAVATEKSAIASSEIRPAPEPIAPPARLLRLHAPARLDPAIRNALEQIVVAATAAHRGTDSSTDAQGLFIPLKALADRALDPAVVVRALDALGMLSRRAGSAKTVVRAIDGKDTAGLVLASNFVGAAEPAPAADLFPGA